MRPKKCPRCELNYILDGADLCPVCRKVTKVTDIEEVDSLCIECGTNPVLPGEDFCQACITARRRRDREAANEVEAQEDDMRSDSAIDELEIELPDDDIPEGELAQMEDDLDYDEDEDASFSFDEEEEQ